MSEFFDRVAKAAAGGTSRRDALKYLGGILAGGFLMGLPGKARADDDDDGGDDDDDNKAINTACKKYCSKCPKGGEGDGDDGDDGDDEGVHGKCISHCKKFLRRNPKGTLCGTCTAKNPFTGCLAGATCCATKTTAVCVNLSKDVKNCGTCGKVCTGTTPACCSGVCKDLASDVKNCGKCGNVCPGKTPKCTKGVCG